MPALKVTNQQLLEARTFIESTLPGRRASARDIASIVQQRTGAVVDVSTIRGRFLAMGQPLGSAAGVNSSPLSTVPTPTPVPKPTSIKEFIEVPESRAIREPKVIIPVPKSKMIIKKKVEFVISEEMKKFIPQDSEFTHYIERPIDKRLALHYNAGKYPLTQGKQGTGKTFSHMYYAWKNQLPFFLFSCYEDFRLQKMFGDKTIRGGNVLFQESLMVKAIQGPCLILYDEINAISNENSYDFHPYLQNKEFFVKDADNGNGKIYKLHPECRIGFAQNPKSAKYMGGNIKPSNFLGRCTYITYPEFTKKDIKKAIEKRFTNLTTEDVDRFIEFYFACIDTINRSDIPVDISIRQLINVIDLYSHGLPLKEAIEDGLSSILEAVSQPKSKEAFHTLAEAVWKDLMNERLVNHGEVGNLQNFLLTIVRRKNGKSIKKISK